MSSGNKHFGLIPLRDNMRVDPEQRDAANIF